MKILVLNSGSSSQKSSLYDIGGALPEHPPEPVWQAKAEWNGEHAEVTIETARGGKLKEQKPVASREKFLDSLLESLWSGKMRVVAAPSEINVVGHRVVNGGQGLPAADFNHSRSEGGDRADVRICAAA